MGEYQIRKKNVWSKEEKINEVPDNKGLLQNREGTDLSFMLTTPSKTDMGLKSYQEKFKEGLKGFSLGKDSEVLK